MILAKLNILKDSNIIDEDTHKFVLSVLNDFLHLGIITKEDEADVFITHLAMADSRRKADDISVGAMDAMVLNEIESNGHFNRGKQIWDELAKKYMRMNFSENENHYIHLHLLNLLDKEG